MSTTTNNNPGSAAFTPGPYRVGRGAQGEPFAVEAATRTVALVKTHGNSTEANARLLAAAPDLLAALSGMLDSYIQLKQISLYIARSDAPNWIGRDMTPEGDVHVIAARAAIRAVEGGAK